MFNFIVNVIFILIINKCNVYPKNSLIFIFKKLKSIFLLDKFHIIDLKIKFQIQKKNEQRIENLFNYNLTSGKTESKASPQL